MEDVLAHWFQAMATCGCAVTTKMTSMSQLSSKKSLLRRKFQAKALNLKKMNKQLPIAGLIALVFSINKVRATSSSLVRYFYKGETSLLSVSTALRRCRNIKTRINQENRSFRVQIN